MILPPGLSIPGTHLQKSSFSVSAAASGKIKQRQKVEIKELQSDFCLSLIFSPLEGVIVANVFAPQISNFFLHLQLIAVLKKRKINYIFVKFTRHGQLKKMSCKYSCRNWFNCQYHVSPRLILNLWFYLLKLKIIPKLTKLYRVNNDVHS